MGLRDLFGKREVGDEPAPAGEAVHESTFVRAEANDGGLVAFVLSEKVSDREAKVVEQEILAAADAHGHAVIVDLSEVMLLTSSGIGMLVQVHKACAAKKGKAIFCGIMPEILETLKMTRMDKLFTIVPDLAAARGKL